MDKLFNLDSPVMRGLSRLADLMLLNICVLVTCFPVITIGASLSAMHYVLIKMARNEDNYVIKMYFKAFKENFKQGTILWLIQAVILGIFGFDYYIFIKSGIEFSIALMVAVLAVFVLFLMTYMYVYPMQARFVNTVQRTIRNAFFMMILNFPKSILMAVVYVIPVFIFLVSSYAVPFLIMFGVTGPSYAAVYLYKKVFSRFEPAPEEITSDMNFSVSVDDEETVAEENAEITPE